MKKFLILLVFFLLASCGLRDERRNINDAHELANSHESFDVVHFVVSANCDYDYFFEYEPMRIGGYYAYGYEGDFPRLLVIPKQVAHDAKLYTWPLTFSIEDVIDELNEEDRISLDGIYASISIELTSDVLNDYSETAFDHAFFIVIESEDTTYIAFQQNMTLVIYDQDEGPIA